MVTEVVVVTATAPAAVVFVNNKGEVLSTSFGDAEPTPAPVAQASAPAPAPAPAPTSEAPAPEISVLEAPAAPVPETPSAPAPASGSGRGITYSPYNGDGTCKSAGQISSDIEKIKGYGSIRIYGTDCNQVPNVLSAVKANGMKLFAGIFDINQVTAEANNIISAAKGGWDAFDTISVGNELVNSGAASASAVIAALNTAKALLRAAGYSGPVVTVDTFVALIAHPELCQASDYAAANCHAFFDGGVEASGAGEFVLSQAQRVSAACGGKHTVITETGWPSAGSSNKKAVPSPENQSAAVESLKKSFGDSIILFTAFDDKWKKDTAFTFNAEQHWGILN